MIKFTPLTWSVMITFLLALVAVMLNTVVGAMIYVALALLSVGFTLLSVNLFISYKKKSKEDERIKEELLMELSVTEDGEEYVIKNDTSSKKYRKILRRERLNKLMPVIFSAVVAALMLFLLIKTIVKF